ncbi:MAG: hypothetical protein PHQ86_08070 [Dehalococcoidales bacterium]|nr:hypothetical protein [Dehalococcoidales bacterium]
MSWRGLAGGAESAGRVNGDSSRKLLNRCLSANAGAPPEATGAKVKRGRIRTGTLIISGIVFMCNLR